MQTLYANLMGSVVVIWALLRIVEPLPAHGLLDGVARTLFAMWQAYALAHGATRLLWLFLVVEVAFGIVQLVPWRIRRASLVDDLVGSAWPGDGVDHRQGGSVGLIRTPVAGVRPAPERAAGRRWR
jgi:hypothetical protein